MHTQRRMAGVVEVIDYVEWHSVRVGKPFDQRSRAARDRLDNHRVVFAFGFALDVGGEQIGAVGDALGALEARTRCGDEPGR